MEQKELICDCNIIHQDRVNDALQNRPSSFDLDNLSQLFKILGDKTRINIIWTLDNREMCVCDIANVLNMTKSSISHQLAIVKYYKSGKEVYYTLDDEHINKLYEIGLLHIEHRMKDENEEI